jgi:hypothetical protein
LLVKRTQDLAGKLEDFLLDTTLALEFSGSSQILTPFPEQLSLGGAKWR